ncbi:hypothetical protein KIN20_027134 [Parelaphostrongylus tenuis]|uniref:Uncharacterized protein n=1 Tax=Parelaphostrongylus tenuis TaxID=148309 RepID=A0AAD5QYZ9_PARTN|nr:hypothetical protein KIN20_027134 [Parelaphostrongylus tenuis]
MPTGKAAYRPGRDVCMNESMVPFKARSKLRLYAPCKRTIFNNVNKGGITSSEFKEAVYVGYLGDDSLSTTNSGVLENVSRENRCLCEYYKKL